MALALALAAPVPAAPVRALIGKPAAQSQSPSVVVIITDDQRFDTLKLMPYVSGRDDWIRFDRAYYEDALCCPTRATGLRGQYSHNTGVVNDLTGPRMNQNSTLATWLHHAGYRTGLAGKYLSKYPWGRGPYTPPGWDDWHAFREDDRTFGKVGGYYRYTLVENGRYVAYGSAPEDYSTDVLAARATAFIHSTPPARPLFLWFTPHAPHDPATPAPRHIGVYSHLPFPASPAYNVLNRDIPWWKNQSPVPDQTAYYRSYAESLLAEDDAVRAIFAALTQTGRLDHTVVIFTSDNGLSFGDHRYARKECQYEGCEHAPLLVRYPGQAARTEHGLVSDVDWAPTIADIARVTPPYALDGVSFKPLLTGTATSVRSDMLMYGNGTSGPPEFWAVRDERYKYVQIAGTSQRELYDLQRDPWERDNRAGDPAIADVQRRLAARLAVLKTCDGAACR